MIVGVFLILFLALVILTQGSRALLIGDFPPYDGDK